ncbi:MAG TPA: EF-Tu/IF-2/RF-3 family GTPase, partial [Steroidobacteraceae bacterium]
RIRKGSVKPGQMVTLLYGAEERGSAKIGQVLTYKGLEREPVDEAFAGDIVAITGVEEVNIGVTVCDPQSPQALPPILVDEPTIAMNFQVNTSPLAGREGKFVTSRQLRERLYRELQSNVALRVDDTEEPDVMRVSGRGELHLTILIENMRREGYELAVSRPQVLVKTVGGEVHEPYEALTVDIEDTHQGAVMEALGTRRADLTDMAIDGNGRVRLEYRMPARGLIGFQGEFMTMTRGTGLISHIFDGFAPMKGAIEDRHNGVLVSNENGEAVAYSIFNLQERGRMFVSHGEKVYEGMIIGIHSRENDLVVNPIKTKKLTNIRAAGKDDALLLTPPIQLTLEYAVEFIADDELVEVTPLSIRIRKRFLKETDRKRASRSDAA